MMKRLVYGGTAAIILVIVLFLILFRKGNAFSSATIPDAVPSDAILFIDKLDYNFFLQEMPSENLIWKELLESGMLSDVDSLLRKLQSGFKEMPMLMDQMIDEGFSLSIHLQGKANLALLAYLVLDDHLSSNTIDTEIQRAAGENCQTSHRRYEAVDLTALTWVRPEGERILTYAVTDGLLIVGSSSIVLEDAIRSLHSDGGIANLDGFQKVRGTAGKYVYGNLYLNYRQLDQLFYPYVEGGKHKSLAPLGEFADWGEFDIDFRDNLILLNGLSVTKDSIPGWLNLFSGQSAVKTEASSFIPANATSFMAVGISDVKLFGEQFRKELMIRGELMGFTNKEQHWQKTIGGPVFNSLLGLINDEIAWFTTEDNTSGVHEEVVIYELRSKTEAVELLTAWVSVLAAEKGAEMKDFITKYSLDEQTNFNIYQFPEDLAAAKILQKFIKQNFSFYDNYLIFSDSKSAISRTIYQNILHKTLENESNFEEVNNLLSTRANITIFLRPSAFISRQEGILQEKLIKESLRLQETVQKFPGMVIQFSQEGQIYYANVSLKYASSFKEKALTVWESLLDTVALTKPYLVENHYTSEKEIIIQDASNALYLINGTGRVLWHIKLDGPVLSEIYQVDYYQNGKFQYLFNTAKKIHLIDRNGNFVERYPVKLREDATNGMVLFDYDKRRDYRIFIASSDRSMYVYNLEGNIVTGWSMKKTEGTVTKPVQHFRIADRDYILFSDQVRNYILDRQGRERVKVKEPFVLSKNNMFYLEMNIAGSGPRFVSTDTSGNVVGIDLQGKVQTILSHHSSSDHYFRLKDLDKDGAPEYIFADGNQLEILKRNGKRLFSFKLKSDISNLPDIYEFSSTDLKIGVTDAENNSVYLLNTDGTLVEGFPLEGNTRFSIGYFTGSDSRFNLIVGSKNGFLYNYSIE